jgi:hypothetical protein
MPLLNNNWRKSMSIKERIQAEIDTIPEECHNELYKVVREFAAAHNGKHNPGIMERLLSVKINAPVDFAEKLDLYTSGEKRVEDNLP